MTEASTAPPFPALTPWVALLAVVRFGPALRYAHFSRITKLLPADPTNLQGYAWSAASAECQPALLV